MLRTCSLSNKFRISYCYFSNTKTSKLKKRRWPRKNKTLCLGLKVMMRVSWLRSSNVMNKGSKLYLYSALMNKKNVKDKPLCEVYTISMKHVIEELLCINRLLCTWSQNIRFAKINSDTLRIYISVHYPYTILMKHVIEELLCINRLLCTWSQNIRIAKINSNMLRIWVQPKKTSHRCIINTNWAKKTSLR